MNVLYRAHGVSTVIVTSGVGKWLEVPDAVVRVKGHRVWDGLKMVRSIS